MCLLITVHALLFNIQERLSFNNMQICTQWSSHCLHYMQFTAYVQSDSFTVRFINLIDFVASDTYFLISD